MKKYRLNQLDIQVTRKCNLYCNHCICGDSHDMEIPFEAIDRILDCVEEIDTLFFTGGEPLLNIPAIEYTIEGIIKRKIPVYNTTITINGTILSNEFVRIFRYGAEKLYQIVVSRICWINYTIGETLKLMSVLTIGMILDYPIRHINFIVEPLKMI